ncbi:shikimate kinase [Saccharospirillum sp. MSK14-1]|uniref:shikimate kinase AroK n=1 Tax=Saccharospirillum sp. MSK14-1 TaxID=1897632 RepID=UPI000D3779A2|nr:shikimate kinase AroK [Saccharospirillum sp. MSK14-1]PTY38171.1 shikimate kinase [Saccharospirillum sp. MSK14-1]
MNDISIILIGPMGSGKSTIGRLLSTRLGLPFIDSDREIEARSGADIPWIFDLEGESGFRDRETAVLAELVDEGRQVIATGGGAIIRPENRELLKSKGQVVYLKTSVEQQLVRTAKDRNRPLLNGPDPEGTLRRLAGERRPYYEETAHLTIDTNGQTPRTVVREIIKQLKLKR